ncbi:MAG: RluA family pseudouridine synthase [Rhodospirillales bacterium]|nr:RluA family pseudouridine synthase [Rhodospirillales bacterium]
MSEATTYTVRLPQDKARLRLDRALADVLPALSRTRLKALIEAGRVMRDGRIAVTDPAAKVMGGDTFTVAVPAAAPAAPRPQAMPLAVVYEDDDLIVVDKPAGLVVHPAAGNPEGTLVNALLAHCGASLSGIGGVMRPGIVHRLDKGTSGLMVAAKNDAAHRALAAELAERKLERAYKALVWGVPKPRAGKIEGLIGRDRRQRKKMAVVKSGGKPALTRYRVLMPVGTAASLVECRLNTGRTHQIRVHMAAIGHPVVGDPVYGGRPGRRRKGQAAALPGGLNHQALHAYLIGFEHPRSHRRLRFESNLPLYFKELLDLLDKL